MTIFNSYVSHYQRVYGKIKAMFQTTNQFYVGGLGVFRFCTQELLGYSPTKSKL